MTTSCDAYSRIRACLLEREPCAKVAGVQALTADVQAGRSVLEQGDTAQPVDEPGRPDKPLLVNPRMVGRRQVSTIEGRAALIHSITHIEFNAVNLALDAAYRFRHLPQAYYRDWIQVAAEEAYHFTLLRDHLRTLGYEYGSFTAHDGLWDMARKTAHDPLVRMALVPRVLEARGLDVSPVLIHKLKSCGDADAVAILEIIQRDEIGHVRIGTRWYNYLCSQRDLDPVATFEKLLREFNAPRLRPPFDNDARRAAGFSESELRLISELAATT